MGRPKRNLLATAEETLTPPDTLAEGESIARIVKAAGNNLYNAALPTSQAILVELPARFRSTIWMKRGSYVLVDTTALADRENKLDGEIINVVRDERAWRKQKYWPAEFAKKSSYLEDSDEDDSTVGKLPPEKLDEEV
ncbi:nucleic acid-binding protein [Mytilinidion resinicola]|uniref:Nucleic acid-binding protein n=1 Tax=Mytilinidion resinicola TaxID=574789 RepID=A0A6A6YHF2_9PEZI|nr:nucleic acid-binding protein [Mytilinidion resinicola]KAF2808231.1 nucleic acid-binding protein [Mytilinidion resinicola]